MLAHERSPQEGREKESVVQEQGYRYGIDIFWSDEDGCFIACVPDLDNCAAWGTTYEEALAQAHEAIRADLASRRRVGDPIPTATPRVLA
jgi:predicted RNase H-like HicB family nuclease